MLLDSWTMMDCWTIWDIFVFLKLFDYCYPDYSSTVFMNKLLVQITYILNACKLAACVLFIFARKDRTHANLLHELLCFL